MRMIHALINFIEKNFNKLVVANFSLSALLLIYSVLYTIYFKTPVPTDIIVVEDLGTPPKQPQEINRPQGHFTTYIAGQVAANVTMMGLGTMLLGVSAGGPTTILTFIKIYMLLWYHGESITFTYQLIKFFDLYGYTSAITPLVVSSAITSYNLYVETSGLNTEVSVAFIELSLSTTGVFTESEIENMIFLTNGTEEEYRDLMNNVISRPQFASLDVRGRAGVLSALRVCRRGGGDFFV